jgi:hypothetical protein
VSAASIRLTSLVALAAMVALFAVLIAVLSLALAEAALGAEPPP